VEKNSRNILWQKYSAIPGGELLPQLWLFLYSFFNTIMTEQPSWRVPKNACLIWTTNDWTTKLIILNFVLGKSGNPEITLKKKTFMNSSTKLWPNRTISGYHYLVISQLPCNDTRKLKISGYSNPAISHFLGSDILGSETISRYCYPKVTQNLNIIFFAVIKS